jgi:hypothetical protein
MLPSATASQGRGGAAWAAHGNIKAKDTNRPMTEDGFIYFSFKIQCVNKNDRYCRLSPGD